MQGCRHYLHANTADPTSKKLVRPKGKAGPLGLDKIIGTASHPQGIRWPMFQLPSVHTCPTPRATGIRETESGAGL